jgi:hypothetical protein
MTTSIQHLLPPFHYAQPSDTTELRIDLRGAPRPAVIACGPCTAYGPDACTVHRAPTTELHLLDLRPAVTRVERPNRLGRAWAHVRTAFAEATFTRTMLAASTLALTASAAYSAAGGAL